MQTHVLTTLLIAQLHQLVISQFKTLTNAEMEYQYNSNVLYHNWQIQSQLQPPLGMLSPILNPFLAQFYATNKEPSIQKPIVSESGTVLVSSLYENATHFSNNPSNSATHDKLINGNSSYNGQVNSSIPIEYLPTIATPFLDNLAHSIIGQVQQHVQLIKPGTKWCGDGNKARSYEDVGVLYKTDKCCRMHDKCPYYIEARENKFNLYNDGLFTRSHCDCDAAFYDCLKKVNSPFSTGVGITYFNILKMKCFRLEYPIVMCSRMAGWISKHCIEYIVDMAKDKNWQWFDNHEF